MEKTLALIEAHELTRKFGKNTALENLELEVAEGEVMGFLGPNGAGKTTTIRILSGIISPTSGYAKVAGWQTDKNPEELHEVIGLLTESPGFYNYLSARRNLEFFAGFYDKIDAPAQIEKYLKMMGLWERRESKVGTFSKGMKQRLALVRALLHEPKVLFLDEPTAGLDPEAAHEVRELVKGLGQEGRTIFLSTHNLAEAEQLCHRIAIIRTQLLALDTPQNLRQRLLQPAVVVQLESTPEKIREIVSHLAFVKEVSVEGNQLHVAMKDIESNRPELVKAIVEAGGRIMGVSEVKPSLEDVYLSLVKEKQ